MMAAKPVIPKNARKGMQTIRNMKLILLSFHERFLNFRENISISDTSNPENRHTNRRRQTGWKFPETRKSCAPVTKEPQNRAFAGTGSPIKELVWRVSLLNFASRNAEKTESRNAA